MPIPAFQYSDWGQTAGQNIRQNRLQAQAEQKQNMLAQALPQALGGDQNALMQVYQADPSAGFQLQQKLDERKSEQAKLDAATFDKYYDSIDDEFTGALINAPDPAAIYSQARLKALQKAQRVPGLAEILSQELPEQYDPSILYEAQGQQGIKPASPSELPSEVREYQFGLKDPGFNAYQERMKRAGASTVTTYGGLVAAKDAQGNDVFLQPSNRGGATPIQGYKPAGAAGGVASEDERKAAGWYQQAANAYDNMIAAANESPGADEPSVAAESASRIPFVGEQIGNSMLSPGQQKYQQAASSFAEAALRAATGAGVTKDEALQKIRELTPRPGDTEAVKMQKRDSLLVYLDSLKARAGRAAPQVAAPAPGNVVDFSQLPE